MIVSKGKCCVRKDWLFMIALSLLALLCVSCSSADKRDQKYDVWVQRPEDVKELNKVETMLTMTPEKAATHPDYQIMEEISVPYVPEYRIGPGDVLEVVYNIRYEKNPGAYRLEVQDKVSITLPYYPQFNSTVLVRTDGKITVPLVGEVQAESKTPLELAALLDKEYRKYLDNPSITVALEEFNVKIDELKKAITTAARGQSKIAPVAPDGRIALPIIGNVQAEGYTLSELQKTVNEKYAQNIRNLDATMILQEIHFSKIYVLGEVERQGPIPMQSRMTLLDGLSAAGGIKKTANIGEVVIFRNDGLERPIAVKVDLEPVIERGHTYADLRLKPADIVFVPKGKLAKFDEFAELFFTKGVYAVLPFMANFTAAYNINPVVSEVVR